ncbi:restriction endonuclease subunit S [Actinomyces provencensis]|uniref:restriction endonuclease subunit S n=1 Tax=Actinomyces provencensis TaxID=1720198 RepID=UPI001E3454BA|nr:restriction endonuclease subunit S [Actinomyces provencensis]
MPQDITSQSALDLSSVKRIPQILAGDLSRHQLCEGDIVYSRRGDVEKSAYVTPDVLPAICGTGCLRVRVGKSPEVSPRFLHYRLGLPDTRSWIAQHAIGATMPNLNTSILSSVPLTIPALAEQQAIADVLGALDEKIASNSQMVRTLTELAQAHIEHLLLESNSQRLGDFTDILMGSAPKGSSYNEHGDGVLLYQGMRDFGERWPSPRIWTTAPTRIAEANDILVSVRAPVGSINVASERCCIGRGLARIRTRTPATLYHLLRSQTHIFASFNSEGTVYGSINKDSLRELPLMVPNIGLEATELELAPLEARIGAALRESHTLVELRDTLLPALMDGRIRVKDAVRTAEEAL